MKAKITRGKGFKGLLDYVFDCGAKAKGDKQPELIGGNMAGANPSQLLREFNAVRKLRPDIEKAVWHCSLSLPTGERLTAQKWQQISEDFMERMGFNKYVPYVAVRHNDPEHDHIHIIASRIGGDNHLWYGQHEVYKAMDSTQELEKIYNLTPTQGLTQPAERKSLTYKERHQAERTGTPAPREQLQLLIDQAIADSPTAPQLAQRLEQAGVGVRANLASTGKMNGFSFEWEGIAFKGSRLGKAYSFQGLQQRGLTYEPERDAPSLERYRQPTAKPSPSQFEPNESADMTISTESVQMMEGVSQLASGVEGAALQVPNFKSGEQVTAIDSSDRQAPDLKSEEPVTPTQQQQAAWVEEIAPQLVDILNEFQTSTYQGKHRTIEYNKQRNQLSLKANGTETVLLTAQWNQEQQQWEDSGSSLTGDEYNLVREGLKKWQQSKQLKEIER